MNKVLFLISLVCAIIGITIGTINGLALASSSNDEQDENDDKEEVQQVPEKCAIKLEDGHWIELDRPQDVTLSDGTVIKGHNCEQLQQDYATTSSAEYQAHINRVNEAREDLGKMFAPESLSDKLDKIAEALDELNSGN